MAGVIFEERAARELKDFIDRYEDVFFRLYHDSGLWNEDRIIQGYQERADALYIAIRREIEKRLSGEHVLGRKKLGHREELLLYVAEHLVIVRYSENTEQNIRRVESIGIHRKPVIF